MNHMNEYQPEFSPEHRRIYRKLRGTHRTSGTEQQREFDDKKGMKSVNPAKYQYTEDGNYGHTAAAHGSHLRRRTPPDK